MEIMNYLIFFLDNNIALCIIAQFILFKLATNQTRKRQKTAGFNNIKEISKLLQQCTLG